MRTTVLLLMAMVSASASAAVATQAESAEAAEEEGIAFTGALGMNYAYRDFDNASEDKTGDMLFNNLRLGIDGSMDDVLLSAQYYWYSYMQVIHHAWIGYNAGDNLRGQLGVTRVPFGILEYASHGYWEGIPYGLGLEDDYDMGLKFIYTRAAWDLRLAFFKNGEWGDASKLDRYSFDVVKDPDNFPGQDNEEVNTLNARVAYTLDHGDAGKTELGVSTMLGQLYNGTTESSGDRWAAAGHLNGHYGRFNLMLELIRYEYNPENPASIASGEDTASPDPIVPDNRIVLMGAYGQAYPVAAAGNIGVVGVSYDVPVRCGPITQLTFYNDYSILMKDEDSFEDSEINTLGCGVTAGPVYVMFDVTMGRNAVDLGGATDSYAAGDPDADWHVLYNVDVGYSF